MENFSIVNNFDPKILFSNMLMTNQLKLLDLCMGMDVFGGVNLKNTFDTPNKMEVQEIIQLIGQQKFINWELFVNLINLESKFEVNGHKYNSLEYLIKSKSFKLIEFLLDWDLELKREPNPNPNPKPNLINWMGKDIMLMMFKKFYSNKNIMLKLIDLVVKNGDLMRKQIDSKCISIIVSKCSESVIMAMLENKLIPFNWVDLYSNNLIHWACKRNHTKLFNLIITNKDNLNLDLDSVNKGKRTPLHLACIKNNIEIVKLLVENKVNLELRDENNTHPLNYAIKYSSPKLVKLLLEQDLGILNMNCGCENEIFYSILQYQNDKMIDYFISNEYVDPSKINLFTIMLCGSKKHYSQMYTCGKKKILSMVNDFIYKLSNSLNGYYMDNEDDELYYFGRM